MMAFMKRIIIKLSSHIYVFSQLPTVFRILSSRARRQALYICAAMIGVGIFEVCVVALIGAFVVSISDPGLLLNNRYVLFLMQLMGIPEVTHLELLTLCGVIIVIVQFIKMLLRIGVDYTVQKYTSSVDAVAGEKIMQRILTMEYQEAKTKYTPATLFEFLSWRIFFGSSYLRIAMGSLQSLIIALSMSITLIVAQPVMTLLLYGLIGFFGLCVYKLFGSRLDKVTRAYRDGSVEVSEQASMIHGGMREIKLSGLERFAIKPFSAMLEKLVHFRARMLLFSWIPSQLIESIGISALVVIVLILASSATSVSESLATAAIFAVAAQRILISGKTLMDNMNVLRTWAPYLAKIESEFSIAHVPPLPRPPERHPEFRTPGRIELKQVSFQYPGADCEAVHNISFVWEKGMLGVIGLSGAGKSTLIDVLAGLFIPTEGEIRAGESDVHGALRRSWMQAVSYIAQSPFIFAGSLLDNIALPFNPESIDRQRALDACNAANIDFMEDSQGGLDMPLSAGGLNLSGGQRQRVAIARAIYQDCPIIIMDEPTSAMDIANERIFRDVTCNLAKERRVVIISHKMSTISHCDTILWLDKGTLRMAGSPDEIIPAFSEYAAQ